jgi:hypothetical protein
LKGRKSFWAKGNPFNQKLITELKGRGSFRAKGSSFSQKFNTELKGGKASGRREIEGPLR